MPPSLSATNEPSLFRGFPGPGRSSSTRSGISAAAAQSPHSATKDSIFIAFFIVKSFTVLPRYRPGCETGQRGHVEVRVVADMDHETAGTVVGRTFVDDPGLAVAGGRLIDADA